MNLWVTDPTTGQKSVSLTMLSISAIAVVVLMVLDSMDKVKDTSIAIEFFGITSALYMGRKYTNKNTVIESKAQE